jgi:signal transduction histidine kinase
MSTRRHPPDASRGARGARLLWSAGGVAAAGAAIAALRSRWRTELVEKDRAALLDAAEGLRRLAPLVAQEAEPEEIFAAVAEEVGRLVSADVVHMLKQRPDGSSTAVGVWPAEVAGVRSTVSVPLVVDDELWGTMVAGSTRRAGMPPWTEYRMAGFGELVAAAIASSQARTQLTRLLSQQEGLRRVATLVAVQAAPKDVFAAVAEEVGRIFHADVGYLCCYEDNERIQVLAAWSDLGNHAPPGTRLPVSGDGVIAAVLATGRPARVDSYENLSGPLVDVARETDVVSAVASPVSVEGRVWGVVSVASREPDRFPSDTEECLTGFAELASSAIGNTEARAQLAASRARVVAASDDARRRIERDLHDGTQQRLVTLALELREARDAIPAELGEVGHRVEHVEDGLRDVLEEVREIARGVHPAILSEGGLAPAVKSLARRSGLPVELDLDVQGRLPEPVEVAAYYVVSEALTNAAKHAGASVARVGLESQDGTLRVSIRDDGVGGADPARGSGLVGMGDRVEALGGRVQLASPPGGGTSLLVELPVDQGALTS